MNRQESNGLVIDYVIKTAENKPKETYEEMVLFQLSVIATMLTDISKSLAIIADAESEDKECR